MGKSDTEMIKEILSNVTISPKEPAKTKTFVDLSGETPPPSNNLTPKVSLTTPTARPNEINPRNIPKLADISEPIKVPQSTAGNSGTPKLVPDQSDSDDSEEETIVYNPFS